MSQLPAGIVTAVLFGISISLTTYTCSGYSGGSGTATDPFQVASVADWQQLMTASNNWNRYFILTGDIDLAGVTVTPVSPDTSSSSGFQGLAFTGVLDGNGHVIRNARCNVARDFAGLFGCVQASGQIRNLALENANVTGNGYVGALTGLNYGTLSNCNATGAISGSADLIGGLVGFNIGAALDCHSHASVRGNTRTGGLAGGNNGAIRNCHATGAVTGIGTLSQQIGGLTGFSIGGTISNCYSTGAVSGAGGSIGGLIGGSAMDNVLGCYSAGRVSGWNNLGGLIGTTSGSTVSRCYSTGPVSGHSAVGGLVGLSNTLNGNNTIVNCYSIGSVSGSTTSGGEIVGGLVGDIDAGSISNCYSTGKVSGDSYVGGFAGRNTSGVIRNACWDTQTSKHVNGVGVGVSSGTYGRTTTQMMQESTFLSLGWDFVGETINGTADTWKMHSQGSDYPTLAWQPYSLISPTGTVADAIRRPLFRWLPVDGATWYQVSVNRSNETSHIFLSYLTQWVGGTTNWTPTSDMPAGNYRWWMRSWGPSFGYGPWIGPLDFSIVKHLPGTPSPIAPTGMVTHTRNPQFSWTAADYATWYCVSLYRNSLPFGTYWRQTTSLTVSNLVAANYRWWVRGWNVDGYGAWSTNADFTLGPGPCYPLVPTATVTTTQRPPFSWSVSSGATSYYLYISKAGAYYYDKWVGGTNTWTPPWDMALGNYTWWVHPWNPSGFGPWSPRADFQLSIPFAGLYKGTFTGDDYGTFSVTFAANGVISGTGRSTSDQAYFSITGTVTMGGATTMVAVGQAGTGATFRGMVQQNGSVTGTWRNDYWQDTGTFAGQRQ